jgi:hypothetical protein
MRSPMKKDETSRDHKTSNIKLDTTEEEIADAELNRVTGGSDIKQNPGAYINPDGTLNK